MTLMPIEVSTDVDAAEEWFSLTGFSAKLVCGLSVCCTASQHCMAAGAFQLAFRLIHSMNPRLICRRNLEETDFRQRPIS